MASLNLHVNHHAVYYWIQQRYSSCLQDVRASLNYPQAWRPETGDGKLGIDMSASPEELGVQQDTPTRKPKRFQCHRCQRLFARLEHLQRHERTHTQEKPFCCHHCDQRFSRRFVYPQVRLSTPLSQPSRISHSILLLSYHRFLLDSSVC